MSAVVMVVWLGVSPARVQAVQAAGPAELQKRDLVAQHEPRSRQDRAPTRQELATSLR